MAILFDRLTVRDIQASFNPKLVDLALEMLRANCVLDYKFENKNRLVGTVVQDRKRYTASLTAVDQTLQMVCECGRLKDGPCPHVLAVLLAGVTEHQSEEEFDDLDLGDLDFEDQPPSPARPAESGPFSQLLPSASPQEIRADWQSRLETFTVKEMRDLAATWGGKLKGIVRDQVFAGLLDLICAPEPLVRVLDKLPPDTSQVLDLLWILYRTGPNFQSEYVKPYLRAALADIAPQARPLEVCLDELFHLGLYILPNHQQGFFPVPLQVLVRSRVNPALFKPWIGVPPQIEPAQPFRFTQLALRLLLLTQGGRLRCADLERLVGPGNWPLKVAADQAAKVHEILPETIYLENGLRATLSRDLGLPPEEVDLAARLLEAGGLWSGDTAKKVSDKMLPWLQIPPQEQSRRLFALGVLFPNQLEFDQARTAGFTAWRSQPGFTYPEFLNGLSLTRVRLVRLLACMPRGQWFEIDAILRILHGLQPVWSAEFILRQNAALAGPALERSAIWANIKDRKANPLEYEEWTKTYGQFYRVVLSRTLSWLGLVDLGLQNGKAVAVRLSDFGEFLVERRADFLPPALKLNSAPLTLTAAGALALDLEAASPDLIHLVMQIALPDGSANTQSFSHRLPYVLNDTSLGQAFETTGWTLESLISRLEAGLRAPLPKVLRQRLQSIWDRFGRLQIYEGMTLIELADDFALPELLAGSSLSQILLYTFSPRLVAVRSDAAEKFIAELQSKGYTPRVEGGVRG